MPANTEAFMAELAVLSRCHHRNVVRLLGACVDPASGQTFMVQELMEDSLHAWVHNSARPLELAQVLLVAKEMAQGLAYLHPTVLHRGEQHGLQALSSGIVCKVARPGGSQPPWHSCPVLGLDWG